MNVLVTGGAGFVGTYLCELLLAEGHTVRVLDDLSVGRAEHVPTGCELHRGSVLDREVLTEVLHGIDAVVHLAARVTVRGSLEGFVDDARVNLLGTLETLRAAHEAHVRRFVFASSMAVYADAPDGAPIGEEHPREPVSPYGIHKLAAEQEVLLVGRHLGLEPVVLRYFNVFGPRQGFTPYVGVITIFATKLLRGEPPTVLGDGHQTRDFVHVEDIARGTALALTTPHAAGGIFNLGSGRGTSVLSLATMLTQRIRPDARWQHAPAHPGELRHAVADIARARSVLGYTPTTDLSSQLDPVIEAIRADLETSNDQSLYKQTPQHGLP